jgi:hypothetical protein
VDKKQFGLRCRARRDLHQFPIDGLRSKIGIGALYAGRVLRMLPCPVFQENLVIYDRR